MARNSSEWVPWCEVTAFADNYGRVCMHMHDFVYKITLRLNIELEYLHCKTLRKKIMTSLCHVLYHNAHSCSEN